MIEYKKAEITDAVFLLRLKNQKDVRRYSIVSKNLIKKHDHIKWLLERLRKSDLFLIILSDRRPIGDVRIENLEISIRIMPKYRGMGIGKAAINEFKELANTAKIVEGNIKSMNLFIKCGFKFKSYKKGVYTLCSK